MAHHSTKRSKRHRVSALPARGRTVAAAALTAVAAAAGVVGSAAAAPAAGPGPGAVDGDRTTVKAQIAALYRQADQLTQTFDAAQEQEARLSLAVERSQSALQAMQADYQHQRVTLGAIAADQYRAGGVDQRLALMLADHPDTFLAHEAMATRLSEQQSRKVAEVVEERREIIQLQRAAADQISALNQTRDAAAQSRKDVTDQLRKAQSLLSTLSEPQRASAIQADLGADPTDPFAGQQADPALVDHLAAQAAPSDRARAAIDAAIADLGKPYVFGAEGPDAFDCSGLIQQAWRQAGVELPRTSSEQAQAGQQVPLSQIQPGDLVIYYAGRSHIGMYVGDGKIIHAPHPGTSVRYAPLMSMPVNMVVRV